MGFQSTLNDGVKKAKLVPLVIRVATPLHIVQSRLKLKRQSFAWDYSPLLAIVLNRANLLLGFQSTLSDMVFLLGFHVPLGDGVTKAKLFLVFQSTLGDGVEKAKLLLGFQSTIGDVKQVKPLLEFQSTLGDGVF